MMNRIKILLCFSIVACIISVILFDCNSWASEAPNTDLIVRIKDNFVLAAQEIGRKLEIYAIRLFSLFLILDVALLGIRVALNRDQIQDVIKQFIMILLFAGFVLCIPT